MNTDPTLHLTEKDPEPVTVQDNGSILIFSSSHNGLAVPSCLPKCLGTPPEWFNNAHEASDLNMDKLFISMQNTMTDANYIYGNYSRLVCDLNATPDCAITHCSSEFHDFNIPGNMADQCCDHQRSARLNSIYYPYHDALNNIINQTRLTHGGVIILDMHSFTPTWKQEQREVEIGTLRCEKTPLSRALEDYLESQSEFRFISGEPYRVADRSNNAAPLITKNNDLQYLGIEIRSDLISSSEGVEQVTAFIKKCVGHLFAHPDFEQIITARSQVVDT